MISVKNDIKRMTRELNRQQRQVIPQATADTLNDLASKTNTESRRTLSKLTGIPQKFWKKHFKVFRANRYRLQVKHWIGLKFGVRAVDVSGAAQRKTLKRLNPSRPFRATMKSGKTSTFVRVDKTGSGKGSRRRTRGRPASSPANLPIVDVFTRGIYLPDQAPAIHRAIAEGVIGSRFRKVFASKLNYRLRRKGLN